MGNIEISIDEKFEQAYLIMARIIQETGEKYLPIFKRMHEEKELRKTNQDLIKMALQATLHGI